ncbi:MAG: tetratricopeptide repeat protein [Acidobacteriota bacterium]|nr:tetratricopeptide repeat protein [Acidobacteriota bacterium]
MTSMSYLPLVGFVGLLLTSAILVAAPSASIWYYANVGLHPILGILVVGAIARYVFRPSSGHPRLAHHGATVMLAGLLLGIAVAGVGATRAFAWLLHSHAVVSVLGAGLWGAHLWRIHAGSDSRGRIGRVGLIVGACALLVTPLIRANWEREWRSTYQIDNPDRPPTSMDEEGAGADSPFAPSSANTNTGATIPSDFFLNSETCGRCHTDIYQQWNSSAHHFSSFNNQWYRRSIEYMQEVVGTTPSKWCAGCHDHAVFFNGRFDTPIVDQIDTPEAQAGLSCTSCHSIVHVGSTMGQGDFTIEYPPLHDLATSEHPLLRGAHDLLLRLAPGPHRDTFIKPFHRNQGAEFCSSCHKVHLDIPVNDYRWVRGFNEYDNWQGSGVSGQGARSFYYPETPQTCSSCHMPLVRSDDPAAKNGFVRSHRFPGANTALPYVNRDEAQLQTVQDFLRAGQVSIDIFGITRVADVPVPSAEIQRGQPTLASTFAVGEESARFGATRRLVGGSNPAEVFAPLDITPVAVQRGESVRVEVVVRTRNVGHFFPGGTVDAFDVWVELEAVDDQGRVLLHSGAAADEGSGPVDPSAHFYRSLQLDERGNPINKRNAWMTRSVAYVRLIPPGAADTIHYRLQIPEDAGESITLRAKINYRKFAWWFTQWAYAGERESAGRAASVTAGHDDGTWVFSGDTTDVSGEVKTIPDIPTTVMAETTATLSVVDATAALSPAPDLSVGDVALRGRWNDYGIGLLLQGDLRGAEAAFRRVMTIDPSYPDGPVNVARARLEEGDVETAIPLLEQALALDPDLARAHYFLATALQPLGQYEDALEHLQIASEQYPRDRVVLARIGRLQFLQRQFEDAIETYEDVLNIDPENLDAHYNLMLSYRGAGNREESDRERLLYERFKADEAAQAITGSLRRASPEDNNERQAVHEHRHAAPASPSS